jgi:hypothetical protein
MISHLKSSFEREYGSSWIWAEGYDIQLDNTFRWVCKKCVEPNRPQFTHFLATGLQNAREHLWREHAIGAPDGQKKGVAQLNAEKTLKQPSIMSHFKLNPMQPREQQIINTLIRSFDKQYFQRMLIELIVTSNCWQLSCVVELHLEIVSVR